MGPTWEIVRDIEGANIGYRAIVDDDENIVCHPSPMGERNARLIAAAPDMLRVMRELLAIASQYETRDCMTDAKSIIAFIES